MKAIVFDCDGLLLDTEDLWLRAGSALFSEHDREYTPRDREALMGASLDDLGRILARSFDQPGKEEALAGELLSRCRDEMVAGARPRPGALELVRDLDGRRDRAPLGVASNSPRTLVEEALGTAGLDGAFEVVLGADDVSNPKPDPEVYLRCCELLGARPSRSVALEDSPTGVEAARVAGLYVIGVPSQPDAVLQADVVADSLTHPGVRSALALPETR